MNSKELINPRFNILVVDDEESMVTVITMLLKSDFYTIFTADSFNQAAAVLQKHHIDIVITDINLPGKNGIDLLQHVKRKDAGIDVILITAFASKDTAIKALRQGAYDYIEKPFNKDEFRLVVQRALEKHSLLLENMRLKEKLNQPDSIPEIIGNSSAIQHVKSLITKFAKQRMSSILITGASGTGKELTARAVHRLSKASGRFIAINCSAIPDTLLESELFGYERGAFTDADSKKIGIFEQAETGTLLLDEIGDMPYALQSKILRVIQERKIRRLGGDRDIAIDCILISSTNTVIEKLVHMGKFREDLYYRLNVARIALPTLRERKEDIPELVHFFIKKYNTRFNKHIQGIENNALFSLISHDWPGNVRQLEHTIERAVALEEEDRLTLQSIGSDSRPSQEPDLLVPISIGKGFDLNKHMERIEITAIRQALRLAHGKKLTAAKLLNISLRQLRYKVSKYADKLN